MKCTRIESKEQLTSERGPGPSAEEKSRFAKMRSKKNDNIKRLENESHLKIAEEPDPIEKPKMWV